MGGGGAGTRRQERWSSSRVTRATISTSLSLACECLPQRIVLMLWLFWCLRALHGRAVGAEGAWSRLCPSTTVLNPHLHISVLFIAHGLFSLLTTESPNVVC